jgi:hypothetical protein
MDYKNGKIYTIRSHYTDKFYIGATCSTLIKRLSRHMMKANATCAEEILRYEDYYIELLELYPCNSKMELNKREGELIRLNKDKCVNIPTKRKEEYRAKLKEPEKMPL